MNEITLNITFGSNEKELTDTVDYLERFFKNNNYSSVAIKICDRPIDLGSTVLIRLIAVLEFSDDREYTMFVMRFSDRIFIQGSTTYLTWIQRNIVFGLSE